MCCWLQHVPGAMSQPRQRSRSPQAAACQLRSVLKAEGPREPSRVWGTPKLLGRLLWGGQVWAASPHTPGCSSRCAKCFLVFFQYLKWTENKCFTAMMGVNLVLDQWSKNTNTLSTLYLKQVVTILFSRQVQVSVTSRSCWMNVFTGSILPAFFSQQWMAEVKAYTAELQRDLYYKTQKTGKKILRVELNDAFLVINILRMFHGNAHKSENLI